MSDLSSITDLSMLQAMDKEQLANVTKEMIVGNEKRLKELEIVKNEILADTLKCHEILKKLGM